MNKIIINSQKKIVFLIIICLIFFLIFIKTYNKKEYNKSSLKDMNLGRVFHKTTLLKDGKVLIVGNGKQPEIFDPNLNKFYLTAKTNFEHYNHKQLLLPDEKVFIIDKRGNEIFDPTTNKFYITSKLLSNFDINDFSVTLMKNGKVFIAGGDGFKTEIYDPILKKFHYTKNMLKKRSHPELFSLNDGRIIIVGGDEKDNSIESYNLKSNTFKIEGYLKLSRQNPSIILLKNNKLLVIGGFDPKTQQETNKVEIYDIKTKTSHFVENMKKIRGLNCDFKAIQLHNGNVIVYGGRNSIDDMLSSFEVFNPLSEKFIFIENTKHKRWGHSITLLKNGQILITGGEGDSLFDETPSPLKIAEKLTIRQ